MVEVASPKGRSPQNAAPYGSKVINKKVFIRIRDRACQTPEELLESDLFREIVKRGLEKLSRRHSILLRIFNDQPVNEKTLSTLLQTLQALAKNHVTQIPQLVPGSESFLKDTHLFYDFTEFLYNFWRSFDRFTICDSEGRELDKRPYRTFNITIESLTHLIRGTYRDIQENLTQSHPKIYRQVGAGAQVAAIALPKPIHYPSAEYQKLNQIPIIRQILFYPPLVLNPPMNKRSGTFERVAENPLQRISLNKEEWLCYPAKVGSLLILIYFYEKFYELGFSLSNLFDLASDEDLQKKPDAVYLFGVDPASIQGIHPTSQTIFYDDEVNHMMVGVVPSDDAFGYFGYLKKMTLTLHNIQKMKSGNMPFHGALVKVFLKGDKEATLLMMGDSGAGKSETLEAFRELGESYIRDLIVIADDMGSLAIGEDGSVYGYGTETGAFLRLDDLQPGYAYGQIDRAIIMNPSQINARIVLPVTTFDNVIKGFKIDYVLYANNYEQIDENHPLIERFSNPEDALKVFREGHVMSKGTTTTTGLVHTYFANIFGPPQYKEIHEKLAARYFKSFFDKQTYVGQMRTRLGMAGWERKGPEETAKKLLEMIKG